jgi:pimeloyl-ACP methyl ester carboxylesterase
MITGILVAGGDSVDGMTDAVVIPGRTYGPSAPLPMYAGDVAESRGATVHRYWWTEEPGNPFEPGIEAWVRGQVTPLLDTLTGADVRARNDRGGGAQSGTGTPLLIGKSLGTNAASLAADRSLPAVWLTPVLTMPWVAAGLERATAPCLLVGGTADELWDSALARRLSPHVLEVDGADHGMYVPGPLTDSIAVLARVVTAVAEFLETIGWPGSTDAAQVRPAGSSPGR